MIMIELLLRSLSNGSKVRVYCTDNKKTRVNCDAF